MISLGIATHLSGDGLIVSSLLAHDALNHTIDVGQKLRDAAVVVTDEGRAMRAAVDRMGRTDPFGYAGSIGATRAALVMRWRGDSEHEGDSAELIELRVETLRRADGDGRATFQRESASTPCNRMTYGFWITMAAFCAESRAMPPKKVARSLFLLNHWVALSELESF